jgi:hypothetical protein
LCWRRTSELILRRFARTEHMIERPLRRFHGPAVAA